MTKAQQPVGAMVVRSREPSVNRSFIEPSRERSVSKTIVISSAPQKVTNTLELSPLASHESWIDLFLLLLLTVRHVPVQFTLSVILSYVRRWRYMAIQNQLSRGLLTWRPMSLPTRLRCLRRADPTLPLWPSQLHSQNKLRPPRQNPVSKLQLSLACLLLQQQRFSPQTRMRVVHMLAHNPDRCLGLQQLLLLPSSKCPRLMRTWTKPSGSQHLSNRKTTTTRATTSIRKPQVQASHHAGSMYECVLTQLSWERCEVIHVNSCGISHKDAVFIGMNPSPQFPVAYPPSAVNQEKGSVVNPAMFSPKPTAPQPMIQPPAVASPPRTANHIPGMVNPLICDDSQGDFGANPPIRPDSKYTGVQLTPPPDVLPP